jgi:hypothetical protein
MVSALLAAALLGVPTAVFAVACLTIIAIGSGFCSSMSGCTTSGPSPREEAIIALGLGLVFLAAVTGGVVIALRAVRRPSVAATSGFVLGLGVLAGLTVRFVDAWQAAHGAAILGTVVWMLLWLPAARWWLNQS